MKVLIVNTSEFVGGAAIAANRLYRALLKNGVDARMMVGFRQTEDPHVVTAAPLWLHKRRFTLERARIWMANGFSRHNLFAIDTGQVGTDITSTREFKEADVIHLHWINQGFLSIPVLRKIMHSGKRVVWTMHDMWPFTGICHYAGECGEFRNECHNCPLLTKPGRRDLANRTFLRKQKLLEGADVSFVACSHWLGEQAQTSALLRNKHIECIPNPLDTSVFNIELTRAQARRELHMPVGRKLILFASQKVTDRRKGINYLIDMAKCLKEKYPALAHELGFMVMGQKSELVAEQLSMPVYNLGYLNTQKQLALAYRAADVFVTPSLFDNLPNTIVEAMACGTPCVGFRTGGIPEMIDHQSNGYVANYKDAEDLAEGVNMILDDPRMGEAAHYYANYIYDEARIAERFKEIYAG